MQHSNRVRQSLCVLSLMVLVLAAGAVFSACGGGSGAGGSGNPTPHNPDFQLSFNPSSVSIPGGSSAMTALTATALNGFSGQVSVQISGLPAGVTSSPSTATLTPGTPQNFTLSAAGGTAPTTVTAAFTGTAPGLTHTASLMISVTNPVSAIPGPVSTRTRYLRTDAVTEYYLSLNDHWVVFHAATSRFFVTDPFGNQIFVIDSGSQAKVGTITVPGAWSIDDTPDQSTLYVGTLLGDVYSVDPVGMKIIRRYPASEIGPYGYRSLSALVLADGRLALLGEQGGIPSVDGSTSIAIWDPTSNGITIYGSVGVAGVPSSALCPMGNIGGFGRSLDRKTILLGSIDSDGTVCEITESTGQLQSFVPSGSPLRFVLSPDGKYFAFPSYPNGVALYDTQTSLRLAQFPIAGVASSAAGLIFSVDSSTLYVSSPSFVYAYSVPGGQQVGWVPNIVVEFTQGGGAVGPISGPNFGATDGTGLLAGPLEEGFGFVDATQLRAGAIGTQFLNGYLTPNTGPVSGGTSIQLPDPNPFGALSAMYFGSAPATQLSGSSGIISATTPAGPAGPADVYVLTSDGGMQLLPDGFSYGPTILEVAPGSSTAEGAGTGVIYGYGFGPLDGTTIPAGLSVSVGGEPAGLLGFNGDTYNIISQPFPLESIYFKIPAGIFGSSADVVVTTPSGSGTATGAMKYLPATRQFPLAGAALAQGIYDPGRDVYYFTDASRIQVFSRTASNWLAPINIPAPNGATQRLWGLALSPDGSKLAVADINADVIYLVNPDTFSVQTFPFSTSVPQGILVNPAGVAITNSGIVYITADVLGGTGFSNYMKLDTNTGVVTNLGIVGPGEGISDSYLRTILSADGTRVFFNSDGFVFSMDTSNGQITNATIDQGCCYGNYDLALSQNQLQFAASRYLYDSHLNGESSTTLNDREVEDTTYVYGQKLSSDGSLLFQPSVNGIDIFDGRVGVLMERLALPFPLSPNYDALVEDGKDNVLIAITGTNGDGIAVVDLRSIAEPSPLPYPGADISRLVSPAARLIPLHAAASESREKHAKGPTAFPRAVPYATKPPGLGSQR